jgi:hypothetical protein
MTEDGHQVMAKAHISFGKKRISKCEYLLVMYRSGQKKNVKNIFLSMCDVKVLSFF